MLVLATNMVEGRNWKEYNNRLVNRGRVVDIYIAPALMADVGDVKRMNQGKRGRHFEYSNILILASYTVKCVFRLGYRQTEGLVRDVSSTISSKTCPNFRTIWYRIKYFERSGIKLLMRPNTSDDRVEVAIDSTGLKNVDDGEYRTKMYRKQKHWTKFHILVDKNSGRIITARITNDKVGDSQVFNRLANPIKDKISTVYGDGAYDSEKIWNWCERNCSEGVIPVRINSNPKGRGARQSAVRKQFGLPPTHLRRDLFDIEGRRKYYRYIWRKRSGYGKRWIVEATFASFKRMFGEALFSKNWRMKENEALIKTFIYNQLRPETT